MTPSADQKQITTNIEQVRENVFHAAEASGRSLDDIIIVAVSKRHPIEAMLTAHNAGIKHFGENRVAEAAEKITHLPDDIVLHMVGGIQSRKAKDAAPLFDWFHALDRLKIARKLDEAGESIKCLVQVNISGEDSKSGFDLSRWPGEPKQYETFTSQMRNALSFAKIDIVGLMTMAPFADNPEEVRPVFEKMRQLQDTLKTDIPEGSWQHLSMGMTNDYRVAIEEGATIIRVGTAIFGPRDY